MSKQQEPSGFESGWENPDGHPGLAKRARPMFDGQGNPVTSVPEPEPLTPAEQAMFAAMEVGTTEAQAVATGVLVGEYTIPRGPTGEKLLAPAASATRIRELATRGLENPSPAAWAVALDEILRELDA